MRRFSLLAFVILAWLHGRPATAAPHVRPLTPTFGTFLNNGPVFSDFNGDNEVDEARLSSSADFKHVHLVLGQSSWTSLSFDSNESAPGRLVSGDIDSDGDIDLVWISQDALKFIAFLGDGRGRFTVSSGTRLNIDLIAGLLGIKATYVTAGMNAAGLAAILPGYSFIIARPSVYNPYASSHETLPAAAVRGSCRGILLAFKQRGPPARHI